MKKYFRFFGIALLATSLCFATASCTKDNGDDSTEQGGGQGQGQGGNAPQGGLTTTFDGQSWSPEASGYNWNYYVDGENPYVLLRAFQKIEGTSGSFPAVMVRIFAEDGEQQYNLNQFYCNYATNPGNIYEDYLQDNNGNKYTVYNYTYAPSVSGTLIVSGFRYDASTMKVSFTADIDMIDPKAYYGDNDEDGNADGTIVQKHCKVVVNNMQFQAPPQSKAVAEKIAANNNITVVK